jgi:phenylpyruvate tautomerase PptA (4-oxalocrotonate tautomerase family)/quinol monooxygenase YgiN
MPIVTVQIFPGRTNLMKELMARALVDGVAELGHVPRESVHVVFEDVDPGNWAPGPRLASSREQGPPPADAPSHVTVTRVHVKEGQGDAYVAWRTQSLLPVMAAREGFLATTLLEVAGEPGVYAVIEKWATGDARNAFAALPQAVALYADERALLVESAEVIGGLVALAI